MQSSFIHYLLRGLQGLCVLWLVLVGVGSDNMTPEQWDQNLQFTLLFVLPTLALSLVGTYIHNSLPRN